MNLTRVPRFECVIWHFIDSLLMVDLIPEGANVLDIGSVSQGSPLDPYVRASGS